MTPALLELENVSVRRGSRLALDRVSLTLRQGENVAILGPNGCGKSTLVKLIDRELYPLADGGRMRIMGRERWNVETLRSALGVVTNDLQAQILPETQVVEAVVAGFTGKLGAYWDDATDERRHAAARALDLAGASHLLERTFGELSSGEARRVVVARALVHDPGALLLDEPTTSLDLISASALVRTIRGLAHRGKAVVLVTHHLEEIVPEINRVVLLKAGRVFRDGPRREIMTERNLSELFEADVCLQGDGPYQGQVLGGVA